MRKIFLKWSLDILYPLLPEMGEGPERSVYDPVGALKWYGKFGDRKFKFTRRCSSDYNTDLLSCSIVLAHERVCEDELRLSLKLGKPVAILSKQQDVARLEDFLKTLGEECPSVVHIYDKTAFWGNRWEILLGPEWDRDPS